MTIDQLGQASKVNVTRITQQCVEGAGGAVAARVEAIKKQQIAERLSDFDREKLQERL